MSISLKNKKITVLYGGTSPEREISLKSGKAVIEALNNLQANVQFIDVNKDFVKQQLSQISGDMVFIILHGGDGENGTVQAVLDMAHIPYTGSGMAASSIAMSKWRTKQLWQTMKLPTPAYVILHPNSSWSEVSDVLGEKAMIKPACEGSSIGMSIAQDENSFNKARDLAFKYDQWVLAEQWITGEEYTVSILGDEVLPVIGLKAANTFYDFEAKYKSNETQYICPCGLREADETYLQELSLKAFHAVGAEGWGRVDVMRNAKGEFYLLEVNTVPGMTDHSLVPMAAKAAGIDFDSLVYRILQAKKEGALK